VVKTKRIFALIAIAALVFSVASSAAENQAPSNSFTHWDTVSGQSKTVYMRDVYAPSAVVSAFSLGLDEGFDELRDIDCDELGNAYALTGDGRVIVFDRDLSFSREYTLIDESGERIDFTGASGIFALSSSEIYIADTEGEQVLKGDQSGRLTQVLVLPDSALIPSDFRFRPIAVSRDSKGYVYVLAEGSYYGALLYDPAGTFVGFYGANAVKTSALTTISYLWDMLLQNDTKRGKTAKTLPYQFADICVGPEDFVYTVTGQVMSWSGNVTGQLRMLSPGGSNILYKTRPDGTRAASDGINFGESDSFVRGHKSVQQNFLSVQTDERGHIYALDKTLGLIYIYDSGCNLLTAFGGGFGQGEQAGFFTAPAALALDGNRLLVADSVRNTVTVFERTDYGRMLLAAQRLTLDADYAGAKPLWEAVLAGDAGSQLALRGLAKAAFAEENYQLARDFAKRSHDPVTYGQALAKLQNAFITRNFIWLFPLLLLLLAALTAFAVTVSKRKIVLVSNVRLRVLLGEIIHPFRSFQDVKYKGLGSVPLAVGMTALFFVSSALSVTCGDFRFTSFDISSYNSLFQLVQTIGLVALWTLANWSVSVLQQGKGKLREVFTVTAYGTLPLILYNFISIPLSYVITSPGSALISGLFTMTLILTGIILCIGLMTIHDFSFPRFLFTSAITLAFMLLTVFILFMLGMMLSQLGTFIADVFMEAVYR
jgi:sugar lactone lactonase YvrE